MDPKAKIDYFFQNYPHFHYKKRDTIIFAGDIPTGVFYVINGYVRSFTSSAEGKEFTARLYKPKDFFSFRTTLSGQATSHTYETLTEVDVIRAPKEDFLNFLNTNTYLLLYITQTLLDRLNETVQRLEVAIMGTANEKIVATLIFISNVETGDLNIPFTHQEIAALTGLTRETVTLEIDKLKKAGYITQGNKSFQILNLQKLKDLIKNYA